MRILIVDDDELICENVKSKLRRIVGDSSLICDTAHSVVEAKLAVGAHVPDIVITDLNMSGISGLSLVKYIKKNYPQVHIYVLSGYDDYQLVRQAFLNGAEDYLLKPMEIGELKEKVLGKAFGGGAATQQTDQRDKTAGFQMEAALVYIEDNLTRELTMDEVAGSIAISYNYFSRRFKEYTGYGFSEYINLRRIARSKSYLEDPSLKIADIAYKVGYNSASTFSKTFKKYEGCYPADYRRAHGIASEP